MELKIGGRIILKEDYLKIVSKDPKDSRAFLVIGVIGQAVALKNIRTTKTFTLPIDDVIENLDFASMLSKPKTYMKTGSSSITITPVPIVPNPTPQPTPQPQPTFTHIAPKPTGGISVKPVIDIVGNVTSDDNPFGNLYG